MKNSALFAEPNDRQRVVANDARDAINAAGWSIVFYPHATLGERVALKDPGNRGRLCDATRALWRRAKLFVEILMERAFANRRWQRKTGDKTWVDTDASTFLSRALDLFPGSRIHF